MRAIDIGYMGALYQPWSNYCLYYNGAYFQFQLCGNTNDNWCVSCFFLELGHTVVLPEPGVQIYRGS